MTLSMSLGTACSQKVLVVLLRHFLIGLSIVINLGKELFDDLVLLGLSVPIETAGENREQISVPDVAV